jgi:hypothetical protein
MPTFEIDNELYRFVKLKQKMEYRSLADTFRAALCTLCAPHLLSRIPKTNTEEWQTWPIVDKLLQKCPSCENGQHCGGGPMRGPDGADFTSDDLALRRQLRWVCMCWNCCELEIENSYKDDGGDVVGVIHKIGPKAGITSNVRIPPEIRANPKSVIALAMASAAKPALASVPAVAPVVEVQPRAQQRGVYAPDLKEPEPDYSLDEPERWRKFNQEMRVFQAELARRAASDEGDIPRP